MLPAPSTVLPLVVLAALLPACALAAAVDRGLLVANKCCPLGEELFRESASGLSCVPAEGAPPAANASRTVEEPLAALLGRLRGESPPWMLDNITLALGALPEGAVVRYGAMAPCEESDREVVPSTARSRFRALAGGALRLRLGAWGGAGDADLPPEDFCTDRVRGAPVPHLLVACPCRRALCVRKCCHSKQVFAERLAGGVGECGLPTAEEAAAHPRDALRWKPVFRGPDRQPAQPPAQFHLLAQHPLCGPNETLVLLNDGAQQTLRHMWVYGNGSALLEHFGWGSPFAAGRWCGETLLLGDGRAVETAVFCLEVPAPAPPPAGVQTYGALFLVGAFFLALTLAVYAALPELRAPPHAKALMAHCGALLVASVTLACMQLTPVVPDEFCEIGAMTIQFSFLAAFFWLNVLCVDISWAFSGLRGLLGSLLDTSRRKFLWYSLYAWGSPLIITSVTVGMHTAYKHKALPPWVVVPNFGGKECWFYGEAAHWAYFYGPMAVLLAANAALFVYTAARLAAAQCDAAQLNRGDSVRHDRSSRLSSEKRRFILYTKLFLLMGVTWVLEVVSWSARKDKHADDVDPAWFFTDIINTLRGVFIFLIFCCKRKVLQMLRKRASALGLPVGLDESSNARSPTYRSTTSTRQSSLLQLSPLGEIWLTRRASPATISPLPNGTTKGSRPQSLPSGNGTAAKALRSKTQLPISNGNGVAVKEQRSQSQPEIHRTNGTVVKMARFQIDYPDTTGDELPVKVPGRQSQLNLPYTNGTAVKTLISNTQTPIFDGVVVKDQRSQSQPDIHSTNRTVVKMARFQIECSDLTAGGLTIKIPGTQPQPEIPDTRGVVDKALRFPIQSEPPNANELPVQASELQSQPITPITNGTAFEVPEPDTQPQISNDNREAVKTQVPQTQSSTASLNGLEVATHEATPPPQSSPT